MTDALQAAASSWYTQCFQVKRVDGFYDQGVYQRLTPQLSWAKGNIQPASQLDVERLPEGARADGALTVFTDADLRTTEAPNQVADRVFVQGVEYEISTVERWPAYNRYTLTKVGQ